MPKCFNCDERGAFCYGCGGYVCGQCDRNLELFGNGPHELADHLKERDWTPEDTYKAMEEADCVICGTRFTKNCHKQLTCSAYCGNQRKRKKDGECSKRKRARARKTQNAPRQERA